MRVVITGVSGFIGRALAARLSTEGHWVAGIGSGLPPRSLEGDREIELGAYASMRLPDPSLASLLAEWSPDLLYHCAGSANPAMSKLNPRRDFESSVPAVYDLLEAARTIDKKPHIVLLSSGAVYGAVEKLPIEEESTLSPASPYGYHKWIAELLCREYTEVYGIRTSVARVFSAYGPGLRRQIVWDAISRFHSGGEVEFRGTGFESRDFIYIDDLVDALIKIALSPDQGYRQWNVGSGIETSINQLVERIARSMKIEPGSWKFSGERESSAADLWCADIARLEELGFKVSIGLEEGIQSTVNWALKELR